MEDRKGNRKNNTLEDYHASRRSPAIVNQNGYDREIGRVFAEYKEGLVIIDGENKKEHAYLIPRKRIDHYGDSQVYVNIAKREFEV